MNYWDVLLDIYKSRGPNPFLQAAENNQTDWASKILNQVNPETGKSFHDHWDEMCKALEKQIDNTNENQCQHEFKQYQGLRDSYEYCIKCDVKKGSINV